MVVTMDICSAMDGPAAPVVARTIYGVTPILAAKCVRLEASEFIKYTCTYMHAGMHVHVNESSVMHARTDIQCKTVL